jgi:hypothetical protein
MAPTTTPRMTPLAQLVDAKLRAEGGDLATHLAIARTPGPGWKSYDEIADYFALKTGRPFNRVTAKSFAETFSMNLDTRYVTDGGRRKAMPGVVSADVVASYFSGLDSDVFNLDVVAKYAVDHFKGEDRDALRETLAVLADRDAMAQLEASAAE